MMETNDLLIKGYRERPAKAFGYKLIRPSQPSTLIYNEFMSYNRQVRA